MNSTLNILEANLRKMSGVQDALYNDQELWEFDLILMQEPHYCEFDSNIHVTGTGPKFEVIKPEITTQGNQDGRIRSCIWANKNSEYVQIPTDNNDIVIIILERADRNILVASVYIPSHTSDREEDEQQLASYMHEIQRVFQREKTLKPSLEILVASDFNRHDSLRGGPQVALEQRQGEGVKIRDFIEHNDLQLLTPRGMTT